MMALKRMSTLSGVLTCAHIGAHDTELLTQLFRVRTAIWTCKYPERPSASGFEIDDYDTYSSYYALLEGSGSDATVVGGCRVIHAEDGSLLPVARYTTPPRSGRTVEISRFFLNVGRTRSGAWRTERECECILREFVDALTVYLDEECGYEFAYAGIRRSLYSKLTELGVPMHQFGQPTVCGKREFVPTMFLSARTAPGYLLALSELETA